MKRSLVRHIVLLVGAVVILLGGKVLAYSGGDGSEATPYLISDPNDWQEMMNTSAHWGAHFRLTADINLEGVSLMPIAPDANGDGVVNLIDLGILRRNWMTP